MYFTRVLNEIGFLENLTMDFFEFPIFMQKVDPDELLFD